MTDIPYGYSVRMNLSWHQGGWKPCEGFPKCKECRDIMRKRQENAQEREVLEWQ